MSFEQQSPTDISDLFLTLPLRPKVEFKNAGEIKDWLKTETDFMAWLTPPEVKADKTVVVDERYTTVKNDYDAFFKDFSAIIARLPSRRNDKADTQNIQNCKKDLIKLCSGAVDGGLLFSASEEMRLCQKMSDWKHGPTEGKKSKSVTFSNTAIDMLLCLMSNNRRIAEIRDELVKTYNSEVSKIDPIITRIQSLLENEGTKSSSTSTRLNALEDRLNHSSDSAAAKIEEHDTQITRMREDLQQIQTTFSSDPGSTDPVMHWREQADRYAAEAQKYFSKTLAIAIGGGFVMIAYVFGFLSSGLNFGTLFGGLLLGCLTLIMVWICAKLSISCNHMAAESKERSLMALSYMAMSKSGAVSGVERSYFYRAFFRSGSTGLLKGTGKAEVKDEALLTEPQKKSAKQPGKPKEPQVQVEQ